MFVSFEHALAVCMDPEAPSEDQDQALLYCLQFAPPELKAMLEQRIPNFKQAQADSHEHGCGCGCNHDHKE